MSTQPFLSEQRVKAEILKVVQTFETDAFFKSLVLNAPTDQDVLVLRDLAIYPTIREWIGPRLMTRNDVQRETTVTSKNYEASFSISEKEEMGDNLDMLRESIQSMAATYSDFWVDKLITATLAGDSTACYDGQYFFDTDHSEGDSGSVSNDISVDISALPAATHGTVTNPSIEEAQQALLYAGTGFASMLGANGKPLHKGRPSGYVVLAGTNALSMALSQAVKAVNDVSINSMSAVLANPTYTIVQDPRLNSWTDKFAVFRQGVGMKPFVRAERKKVEIESVGRNDPSWWFHNKKTLYGINFQGELTYLHWQNAMLMTLA